MLNAAITKKNQYFSPLVSLESLKEKKIANMNNTVEITVKDACQKFMCLPDKFADDNGSLNTGIMVAGSMYELPFHYTRKPNYTYAQPIQNFLDNHRVVSREPKKCLWRTKLASERLG